MAPYMPRIGPLPRKCPSLLWYIGTSWGMEDGDEGDEIRVWVLDQLTSYWSTVTRTGVG